MNLQKKARLIAHSNKISESEALHLAHEQEKYKLDILQPSDPLFNRVYGDKLKREKKQMQRKESLSKGMWVELEERKAFDKKHP